MSTDVWSQIGPQITTGEWVAYLQPQPEFANILIDVDVQYL